MHASAVGVVHAAAWVLQWCVHQHEPAVAVVVLVGVVTAVMLCDLPLTLPDAGSVAWSCD